jgi:TM2 domain-containing membrane protein YozV
VRLVDRSLDCGYVVGKRWSAFDSRQRSQAGLKYRQSFSIGDLMMPHITHYMPELQEPERSYLQTLVGRMSHEQIQIFASAYRQRRKDPHTVLLTAIIGMVAIPGLQRFWLGQVGVGFLFLFTWGLLLIGSIADLVSYKALALLYNQRVAREIAANMQNRSTEEIRRSITPAPVF